MTWLAVQGAETVADLRELPPGTYTCKELAESLGVPVVKAQRLLTALEGANPAIHHKAPLRIAARLHDRCSADALAAAAPAPAGRAGGTPHTRSTA